MSPAESFDPRYVTSKSSVFSRLRSVRLSNELLEQAAKLRLLPLVVLGPQVVARALRDGARLAEGAVRELVVVDERRQRLMDLRVARRGLGLVEQLLDVVMLVLDEGLRILGGGVSRDREGKPAEGRRDGEDVAEAHGGVGLGGVRACLSDWMQGLR